MSADSDPFTADCWRCANARSDALKAAGAPFSQTHSFRMYVCPDCGNKRCPKAADHEAACPTSQPDERARAEALGVMLGAREQVGLTVQEQSRYVEGFVAGSAWQRSQPVEITEEMVEAGARAQLDFDWHGEKSWLDVDRGVRVQYERGFRAALSAALGGEGR